MLIDARTLSLVIGFGNLVFALLVTVYIWQAKKSNPALETWRWAKTLLSLGFFANITHSFKPELLPPVLGNSLQLCGIALELAAYSLLPDRRQWLRPLAIYASLALIGLQIVAWNESTQNARLIFFSAVSGTIFLSISAALFIIPRRNPLAKLIGFANALAAILLFIRAGRGLFVAELSRFAPNWINLSIYFYAYILLVINGFGFLLLAKQQDDKLLAKNLEALKANAATQRRILSTASHEFRTPAAQIKTSLDSLRFIEAQIPPEVAIRLNNIHAASSHLVDLADNLISQEQLLQKAQEPVPPADATSLSQ